MTKKEVIKSCIFAILFLFLLQSVTYILRTNGEIKDIFTGFYAEPKDTIDVVLIGSSPVYPYYVAPKMWGEYGFTAYPLSSNMQRPKASIYLVKEALKTQSPDLFVFELRLYTANDADLLGNMAHTRGVTDNLKYSMNRIEVINELVSDPKERYTYYFDIFKYHSNWRSLIDPTQVLSVFYQRPHPLKGYAINTNVIPAPVNDFAQVTSQKAIPIEEEEVLKELLAYLEQEQLQALFITSPKELKAGEQEQFNYMQKIVEDAGYNFLNLNHYYTEMGFDFGIDFYDAGGHTNTSGAGKTTELLANYIKDNYQLEDKRGQEKYASWDRAYEQWLQEEPTALEIIADKVHTQCYDEMILE